MEEFGHVWYLAIGLGKNNTITTTTTKQHVWCAASGRALAALLRNQTEHVGKHTVFLLLKREQRLGPHSSRTSETPGANEVGEAEEQRCQKKRRAVPGMSLVQAAQWPSATQQSKPSLQTGDCVRQWNGNGQRAGELKIRRNKQPHRSPSHQAWMNQSGVAFKQVLLIQL